MPSFRSAEEDLIRSQFNSISGRIKEQNLSFSLNWQLTSAVVDRFASVIDEEIAEGPVRNDLNFCSRA